MRSHESAVILWLISAPISTTHELRILNIESFIKAVIDLDLGGKCLFKLAQLLPLLNYWGHQWDPQFVQQSMPFS